MKILIHYGYGKTGSTSLQIALANKRKILMQHRVYYPKIPWPTTSHHLLQALFKSEEQTAPHMISLCGSYDNMVKMAYQSWNRIKQQVSRKNPKVLLLSSEMFFGDDTLVAQQKFFDLLSELSSDIQPIFYIRDPADLYLSRLQETSRNSFVIRPPAAEIMRKNIEHLETAFGRKLRIRAFQRDSLVGGDIVNDFVTTYLADYVDSSLIPTVRANESMSAEATEMSLNFRRVLWPNDDRIIFPKNGQFLLDVGRFEAAHESIKKPVLLNGLADQIRRASTDYIWLKDKYGVSFDTLDYAKIDGTPVPYLDQYENLSGIIRIDWVRYNQILYSILSKGIDLSKERQLVIGKYNFKFSNIIRNIQLLKKQTLRLVGR